MQIFTFKIRRMRIEAFISSFGMQCTGLPYTLVYKPTIFGWILTIKLWGLAYSRVMPHIQTSTARVSTAWTISRQLGLRVHVGACAAGSGTTHRLLVLLDTS